MKKIGLDPTVGSIGWLTCPLLCRKLSKMLIVFTTSREYDKIMTTQDSFRAHSKDAAITVRQAKY